MNAIKSIRTWLTLDEAAREITTSTGALTDATDLLRLASDSELNLSVRFRDRIPVKFYPPMNGGFPPSRSSSDDQITWVNGVYEFVVYGAGFFVLEDLVSASFGGEPIDPPPGASLFIKDVAGDRIGEVQFVSPFSDLGLARSSGCFTESNDPAQFMAENELPDFAELGIRTSEIQRLLQSLNPERKPSAKTTNQDLLIISTLARALIGPLSNRPTKDAQAIEAVLASKGLESPCSGKTLAGRLKQAINS